MSSLALNRVRVGRVARLAQNHKSELTASRASQSFWKSIASTDAVIFQSFASDGQPER